ncbi:hypothetical protein HMPREF9466_00393 [Fusobacterium necrophorum subsp. funduliforme 1_1_36S]|nr:hypothetical protein HMPREF9466_00393 [Fusobacterium necrophorum subsp. funduliforme 1_1_36S]
MPHSPSLSSSNVIIPIPKNPEITAIKGLNTLKKQKADTQKDKHPK